MTTGTKKKHKNTFFLNEMLNFLDIKNNQNTFIKN